MKSGNLKFLETSGSLQACNGTAALPYYSTNAPYFIYMLLLPEEKMSEICDHLKNKIISDIAKTK